jgi:16S rRNA (guanine1207-N2)-methyltransferase
VVCWLPPGNALQAYLIAHVADRQAGIADAESYFVCALGDGGRSAHARIAARFGLVEKYAHGHRCVLYRATAAQSVPSEAFVALTAQYHDHELAVISLPGVFSQRRLDPGTALLLEVLGPIIPEWSANARVLDLACGAGVIGCWLARQQAQLDVTLSDVSALATESAQQTAMANGLSYLQPQIHTADGVSAGVSARPSYDIIIANLPFHDGKNTDRTLTRRLLTDAAAALALTGQLILVANRFVPIPRMMSDVGLATSTLHENQRYWVVSGQRQAQRHALTPDT